MCLNGGPHADEAFAAFYCQLTQPPRVGPGAARRERDARASADVAKLLLDELRQKLCGCKQDAARREHGAMAGSVGFAYAQCITHWVPASIWWELHSIGPKAYSG